MNEELWYFLLEGKQDKSTGVFGNFYAYGTHLGEALEKTLKASVTNNFYNPHLIEAGLLESLELVMNVDELIELNDAVYKSPTIHAFPYNDPDKSFIPPIGIVKSIEDGEYEYDLIKETFVAYGRNENGIFEFEFVVSKKNLIELLFKSINFLPSIDGFWIYINNFWDDDQTELWVAKHFTDKTTTTNFLKEQQKNILENGYLDIVVHSITGQTNLTLDAHKKIKLTTIDEDLFNYTSRRENYIVWNTDSIIGTTGHHLVWQEMDL